ncbi:AMP-binding protein [Rhodococcus fascians]|nr:AMP-binding protein [Rhodococcus fascians]MBY4058109.1 AMP-binding protein [Rhodococcus fascians]MBY4069752.1 AMP-binding protein [Rhodococcus fascians]
MSGDHTTENETGYEAICGWLRHPHPNGRVELADDDGGWIVRRYSELAADAETVAAGLVAAGLEPDDAVCVIMPTGFALLTTMYGAWAAGGVLTLAPPPAFGEGDGYVRHLSLIFAQVQPRLVVTSNDLIQVIERAQFDAGLQSITIVFEDLDSAPSEQTPPPTLRRQLLVSSIALVQFTSGSSGSPKGVRISWRNLAANTAFIAKSVDWKPRDVTVSWLPLYHDMGLVGAVLTTIARQGDLRLLRPDQFIREPLLWIRALAEAQHAVSPSFGLGYTARRLGPADVESLDLSSLRSVISGAEPIDPADVESFSKLLEDTGFEASCLRPAYGLAESTLMATMATRESQLLAVRVDSADLRLASTVTISEQAVYAGQHLSGPGWIVGLGNCDQESTVRIVDAEHRTLPHGVLGEVVLAGPSVAEGYHGPAGSDPAATSTHFANGEVFSGDAGFLYQDNLFVLGRIGSSIKVRGKAVFMEDVDARLARVIGIAKHKVAAVSVPAPGASPSIVLFVESDPGEWLVPARAGLRAELGPGPEPTIVTGPRGLILRTSSGKPRRRAMWELFTSAGLDFPGVQVHNDGVSGDLTSEVKPAENPSIGGRRKSSTLLSDSQIGELLRRALDEVKVHPQATIVLEGSIAEGFGNRGSDIDFLAVSPGGDETPEMPTVLFVDGRRVEVRTRSERQLREQLSYVYEASTDNISSAELLEFNQDILNRCQRFLRSATVRSGAVDLDDVRAELPFDDLARLLTRWWRARATQSLRLGVAMAMVHADMESAGWMLDGALQAVKAWAAQRGETYLEAKWIGPQLDRIGDAAVAEDYFAIVSESRGKTVDVSAILAWVSDLGCDVGKLANSVRFTRVPGITSWPVDGRIHVLSGKSEVFVLSDRAAAAWRHIVFSRPLTEILTRADDLHTEFAEFVRLGFVGVSWGREPIRPAVVMVKPFKPYTPPPSRAIPLVGIAGGARDVGRPATLSPLPAQRFVECASSLVWSNVIVENAREDLVGALSQSQCRVADVAADRLIKATVRLMLSTLGSAPLPPDVAPASTLDRLMPPETPNRAGLLRRFAEAQSVSFENGSATEGVATLDALIEAVRTTAELKFPESFDSRTQWRRTLEITYDWLRMAAFLNAELPIDEVQDLLSSGGAQPHESDVSAEERDTA